MSNHVYKMVEFVGSSTTGTDDAIRNAIEMASGSVRHLDWFEVVQTRGHVVDGKVAHYQVTLTADRAKAAGFQCRSCRTTWGMPRSERRRGFGVKCL